MNKAVEFHNKVMEELKSYNTQKVSHFFKGLENGDSRSRSYAQEISGVYGNNPCIFYHYLACAVRLSKTKDAVELGADRGVSALFIQSELPGTVYSVDIEENKERWQYVPEKLTKIKRIVCSSINPILFSDIDLKDAKFWLIDSLHTDDHFDAEVKLHQKRWTPGTVVMVDDMKSVYRPWQKLPYDKYEDFDGHIHGNGVGLFIV